MRKFSENEAAGLILALFATFTVLLITIASNSIIGVSVCAFVVGVLVGMIVREIMFYA